MSTDEVLKAALALSDDQRIYLATRLLDSIPENGDSTAVDDPDFFDELDRRSADRGGSLPAASLWTGE